MPEARKRPRLLPAAAYAHFQGLPKNTNKVVFQGDVNTAFGWIRDGSVVTPVPKEDKGGILLKIPQERGLVTVAPPDFQFEKKEPSG